MSTVVSLICLALSFQKMTHHFLLHGSLRPTNLEKNLKPCLFRQMEFFIKLHAQKSGWSIVHIEGSQVIISKNVVFLPLKIDFFLANSVDPDDDEMLHNATFHLSQGHFFLYTYWENFEKFLVKTAWPIKKNGGTNSY